MKDLQPAFGVSDRETRTWQKGDRCRVQRFGEWRNGTVESICYGGEVACVKRDGERVERAFLIRNLRESVDE